MEMKMKLDCYGMATYTSVSQNEWDLTICGPILVSDLEAFNQRTQRRFKKWAKEYGWTLQDNAWIKLD